ncbi:SGNH/GDSL hydrolase family protein [Actinokineospora globicatena]|uniref:SGNH/GDSL hydrolase family protein n=1 Tax=Actinokineospora globicatena TaxID=103729 RepID=UPI0020A417D2|nr:SGNH/GDSL hydrolase family protein [Actinokineospora globicatena]MCP2302190.1 GDSL-like Lipase/Acylhydrolase family protein [Actinokineospora globicatena]GLW76146.1 lipase [Actinokineospora globicatena]GLW82982.1 lipase [Actinokineospora globicatena]
MRVAAIALSVFLVCASTTPAVAVTPRPVFQHYVALGDSYAAGPGIPRQNGTPTGCGRSSANYAGKLARWLRVTRFVDVSCGGATTVHMTRPQAVPEGENPPQFDVLRADTDLVTITIGGNDFGFGEILATCARLGAQDPSGSPCREHYTAGGRDELLDRVARVGGLVDRVLAEIHQRSPRATVIVVGYLRILPPTKGCWPQVPFAAGDTAYFDRAEKALNTALGERARAAGARFVNPYPYSITHDACQPAHRRWVEPLRPAAPAVPMHPNEAGMTSVAGLTWLSAATAR